MPGRSFAYVDWAYLTYRSYSPNVHIGLICLLSYFKNQMMRYALPVALPQSPSDTWPFAYQKGTNDNVKGHLSQRERCPFEKN